VEAIRNEAASYRGSGKKEKNAGWESSSTRGRGRGRKGAELEAYLEASLQPLGRGERRPTLPREGGGTRLVLARKFVVRRKGGRGGRRKGTPYGLPRKRGEESDDKPSMKVEKHASTETKVGRRK